MDTSLWGEVRGLCLDPSVRDYDVTALSDAIVHIVDNVGDEALPDHIVAAVNNGMFTIDEGSLIMSVATYSTDDEGSRILGVLARWLETGVDELRIALALAPDSFAFRSRVSRIAALTTIKDRFHKFEDRCNQLIASSPDY
ncbi:hypothetical protein WMF37_45605 [Sorangium sp. So ce291]|uniref:hypothetical protein n=1 Tax=Sorangium sp. So ce291 TaxID=3133294 RepID=UPI003F635D2A